MQILVTWKVAFRNLRRTPLRAGLATLGVVIGVAAVITMISLGDGAREKIRQTYSSFASNQVTVVADPRDGGEGRRTRIPKGAGLTLGDYSAIRSSFYDVEMGTPWVFRPSANVKVRRNVVAAKLTAFNASGFHLYSRSFRSGSPFTDLDLRRASSVCVISEALERAAFPGVSALGHTLLLEGIPFQVIGVVENENSASGFSDPKGDLSIFLPITTWLQRFDTNAELLFALIVDEGKDADAIAADIADLMEERRGGRKVLFKAFRQSVGVEQLAEGARTMTMLLAAIAGISLVVGGVGIMNVMLANISERTREIGIRLAVGTSSRDVLRLFLIEAVVLSGVGGALGVMIGYLGSSLLTYLNQWPTRVTVTSITTALLCSAIVGVFFGFFPARKAARMQPTYALRSE